MSFIVLPVLWYMLGSADEIKLQTDMSEVSAAITAKFFPENQQTPIYKVLTCMQKNSMARLFLSPKRQSEMCSYWPHF